jgi:cell division transport system ATP-binding protein
MTTMTASTENAPASETIVRLENANIFQQKNLVLSNVYLRIDKGEFVYLIGKTGSGKSSLLKILYGDTHLDHGDGEVAGFHLHALRLRQVPYLRRKLGIVFQDFQLLTDRSVNANLYFVLKATGWKDKEQMQKRVQDVLEKVGLGTKGFKMPHELSGGEQQRVAIARALLNDPDLILADEPTGNLDPETSEEIMKLLVEISTSGRAVLMATHNYALMDKFPARIIRCEGGKLLDSSTAA